MSIHPFLPASTMTARAINSSFKLIQNVHSHIALSEHKTNIHPFVVGPAFISLQHLIRRVRLLRCNSPALSDESKKNGAIDWAKRPHTLFTHGGNYHVGVKCPLDEQPWNARATRFGAASVCIAPHLYQTWITTLDTNEHRHFRLWQEAVSTTNHHYLLHERVRVIPWAHNNTLAHIMIPLSTASTATHAFGLLVPDEPAIVVVDLISHEEWQAAQPEHATTTSRFIDAA